MADPKPPTHEAIRALVAKHVTATHEVDQRALERRFVAYIAAAEQTERERDELLTFLRTHGPDLMLYLKPQVEGLKRPCRDALGKLLERIK